MEKLVICKNSIEPLIMANKEKLRITPNSARNRILHEVSSKASDHEHSVPEELAKIRRHCWITGTGIVFEEKNKPFGKKVEIPFDIYLDGKGWVFGKKLIFNVPKEHQGAINTALLCEHGFENGQALIRLVDRHGRGVSDIREIDGGKLFAIEFNGKIASFKIKVRGDDGLFKGSDRGIFEKGDGWVTRTCFPAVAEIGFLARGAYYPGFFNYGFEGVSVASANPTCSGGVILEAL